MNSPHDSSESEPQALSPLAQQLTTALSTLLTKELPKLNTQEIVDKTTTEVGAEMFIETETEIRFTERFIQVLTQNLNSHLAEEVIVTLIREAENTFDAYLNRQFSHSSIDADLAKMEVSFEEILQMIETEKANLASAQPSDAKEARLAKLKSTKEAIERVATRQKSLAKQRGELQALLRQLKKGDSDLTGGLWNEVKQKIATRKEELSDKFTKLAVQKKVSQTKPVKSLQTASPNEIINTRIPGEVIVILGQIARARESGKKGVRIYGLILGEEIIVTNFGIGKTPIIRVINAEKRTAVIQNLSGPEAISDLKVILASLQPKPNELSEQAEVKPKKSRLTWIIGGAAAAAITAIVGIARKNTSQNESSPTPNSSITYSNQTPSPQLQYTQGVKVTETIEKIIHIPLRALTVSKTYTDYEKVGKILHENKELFLTEAKKAFPKVRFSGDISIKEIMGGFGVILGVHDGASICIPVQGDPEEMGEDFLNKNNKKIDRFITSYMHDFLQRNQITQATHSSKMQDIDAAILALNARLNQTFGGGLTITYFQDGYFSQKYAWQMEIVHDVSSTKTILLSSSGFVFSKMLEKDMGVRTEEIFERAKQEGFTIGAPEYFVEVSKNKSHYLIKFANGLFFIKNPRKDLSEESETEKEQTRRTLWDKTNEAINQFIASGLERDRQLLRQDLDLPGVTGEIIELEFFDQILRLLQTSNLKNNLGFDFNRAYTGTSPRGGKTIFIPNKEGGDFEIILTPGNTLPGFIEMSLTPAERNLREVQRINQLNNQNNPLNNLVPQVPGNNPTSSNLFNPPEPNGIPVNPGIHDPFQNKK